MRFGSTTTGAVIGVPCLALLVYLEIIPFLLSAGGGPTQELSAEITAPERFGYLGVLFASLPDWVKVWMKFQDIVMAASLLFVLWHREAQVYALGIILSHVFFFAAIPLVPAAAISLDLAALSHWLWIPTLVVLIRAWPRMDKRSGYGAWCTVAIAQLLFSLSFDIPDGIQFFLALV